MGKKYKFIVELKKKDDKDATYMEVPLDVEKEFGSKRVKVKVTFDNVEYRGSIVKMGMPCYIIGVTKEIRNKIGKSYGDMVEVSLEKDEDDRVVEIPEEFKKMLEKSPKAKEYYYSLSYSNRRKYILWITSAKKEETKIKRMKDGINKLENSLVI